MIRSGHKSWRARDEDDEEFAGCANSAKDQLLTALLIDAVAHRRGQGKKTTLRDVHTLLGIGQPVALRLVRRLENEGVACIKPCLLDTLASEIIISSAILDGIDQARQKRPRADI